MMKPFFASLREMNKKFYHQIVNSNQIENFWSEKTNKDLSKLFDQYLRNTQIPTLEVKKINQGFKFRWTNCISGYNAPIKVIFNGDEIWLEPNTSWQSMYIGRQTDTLLIDPNFYVNLNIVD